MKRRTHFTPVLFLFACLINLTLSAQQTVTGILLSQADNAPVSGATIQVKGSSTTITSDRNGRFSIQANAGQTLVITSVGFQPQELVISNLSDNQIRLVESNNRLDDVVVVGYGTARKRDLTGAVASVSGEVAKTMPITSFEQGLQGRVPGVQVVQGNSAPGGAPQVRIRGANTVLGGNEPLYVIDGVPVYNSTLLNQDGLNVGTQPSNALASINPNDIVSMEILKDASATAIYGARGANGVVLITTRRGKASDKGRITFETYYGSQVIGKKLDMMNSTEFVTAMNERAQNLAITLPFPDPAAAAQTNTDWQDLLFRRAPMQNYSLTLSGGTAASLYNISGNWFDQKGIMQNSNFKRGSVRINLDNRINDRLKVATSLTASRSINLRPLNYWLTIGLAASPTLSPYDAAGNFVNLQPIPIIGTENPIEGLLKSSDEITVNRVLGNVLSEYTLTRGLTYSLRLGLDYIGQHNDVYVKKGNFINPAPGAVVRRDDNSNYLIEHIFNFNRSFGTKHRVSATAGYTWQKTIGRFFQQSGTGFQFDNFGTNNLGAATVTSPNVSTKSEFAILSYLGRINYVHNDRYIVTFTSRADGSSRFGANNKWGFFPSGAFAWRISKENFMSGMKQISDLKLRTSYGLTGNQEIGLYNSISRMNAVTAVMGNPSVAAIGYVPTSLANNDLKWEINKQFDAGLDLGLFDNRLSLTADYYHKRTDDLLANLPIAGSSGFSSILINSGSIENKGYELGLNAAVIENRDFGWSFNGNVSHNKSKVLKLAVATRQFFADNVPSPVDRPVNIIREGDVLSAFWGYLEDGLNENGDIRYKDLNKDGRIDGNDQTIIGSPFPDLLYGFNNNLRWKNFDLTVFFQGVAGVKVFNSNEFMIANSLTRQHNQLKIVQNRWSPANPNPNALYPRLSNVQLQVSDRFIQDADYLRMRNIVLGYTVPFSKLNIGWVEAGKIYVSGQNLLTFTNYRGYDPEVSQTGSGSLVKGLDRGSYPLAKVITVGLNVTFK